MYGLRKIHKDGMHYGFQWPLEVGAVVSAPDWNPEAECGGGLHLLPNAQGDYSLLYGHYWAVVEFDESHYVWFREAMQEGYIPFTGTLNSEEDEVSAANTIIK